MLPMEMGACARKSRKVVGERWHQVYLHLFLNGINRFGLADMYAQIYLFFVFDIIFVVIVSAL